MIKLRDHQITSNIKRVTSAIALLLAVVSSSSIGHASALGSASLSLAPATGSYSVGDTIVVNISEDSGTVAVNAVEADLTYDQSQLQYVSVDGSGSAFDVQAPITAGGGVVDIPRGRTATTVTGKQSVAAVHFKVVGNAQSTTVSFASTSGIIRLSGGVNVWNGTTTGATYALSGTVVSAPVATTPSIQPALGYPVSIVVTDAQGKALPNAHVTVGSYSATADSKGVAGFESIPGGDYTAHITYGGTSDSEAITVQKADTQSIQDFPFKLDAVHKTTSKVGYVIAALIILAVILLVIVWRSMNGKTPKANVTSLTPKTKTNA